MNNDIIQLSRALNYATQKYAHLGPDFTNEAYIHHPLAVMTTLVDAEITDIDLLTAAICHDLPNYTDASRDEIAVLSALSERATHLVYEVAYDKNLPQAELTSVLISQTAQLSPDAATLRLADAIANLQEMIESFSSNEDDEHTWRTRINFTDSVVEALPYKDPKLHSFFSELMSELYDLTQCDLVIKSNDIDIIKSDVINIDDAVITSDDLVISIDDIKNDDARALS